MGYVRLPRASCSRRNTAAFFVPARVFHLWTADTGAAAPSPVRWWNTVDLVKHVWGSSRPDPLPKGAVLPDAALKRVQLLFLVCGIGTSMAWYAISGAVAYWSKNYGDDIYGVFLFAYNGPALFLLLAQTAEDDKYDRKFGSKAAYSFRTYLGYVVLFSCCLALLLIDHKPSPGGLANRIPLLIVVGIVGVFDSVGYGSLAQMASKLHPRVSTYMFIGQSLTSFLLLGWTLALGFGASADDVLLLDYFLFPMGWIVVGVIAFTVVMNSSDVTDRLKFVDDQSAGVEQVNPMLEAGAKQAQEAKREAKGDDAEGGDIRRADSKHVEATVTSAVSASWEMQLSTFLVMVSILTVQTFYAQVPSASGTDAANRQLGTTLVYSKFAGEFIGKQVWCVRARARARGSRAQCSAAHTRCGAPAPTAQRTASGSSSHRRRCSLPFRGCPCISWPFPCTRVVVWDSSTTP